METIVTLKESFAKRRILADFIVPAEVKIINGEEYIMYFWLEKRIIEVTHKENDFKKIKLTKEEKNSIIEAVLRNYTSFFKSIMNFSISYYIENFHFADTTTIPNISNKNIEELASKDTILKEYLESGYGKDSVNKLFRVLDSVYVKMKKDIKKIKHDILNGIKYEIQIEYALNFEQRWDLKYYINNILSMLGIREMVGFIDTKVIIDRNKSIIYLMREN